MKKRRGLENGVTAEPAQNGHLDGYGSTEREQDRGKKKVPLKKSKQVGLPSVSLFMQASERRLGSKEIDLSTNLDAGTPDGCSLV